MINTNTNKKSISFVTVGVALVVVALIGAWLILKPEEAVSTISSVQSTTGTILSPFYLWLGFAAVAYIAYFSFTKYGHIRFGSGKPEFKNFTWLVMMFCAGMGSSMMYWAIIEPLCYLTDPPLGVEAMSQEAYELANVYGMFHWTITAWALFAVGAIPMCYRFYILKKPGLSLALACEGVLGKAVYGPLGKIIEIIVVFGILGGHGTTLVLGIPMIQNGVSQLLGVPDELATGIILIGIVTALFMISSWLGLEKGMSKLSNMNAYAAIALAVYFLAVGPTLFQINLFSESVSYLANNFVEMSLWTDAIGQSGFPSGWTSFYWAWWLALGPWMWIFTTRISKGRTLKEVMLGMVLAGSAGCMLYFGSLGGYSLDLQLTGEMDLVATLAEQGAPATISAVVLSLPLGELILGIWVIIAVIFLATTLDSSSYTLAATTTIGLKEGENPARIYKLFWAILLAVTPCTLLFAGADLSAFQAMSTMTAMPIAIFTIIALISGAKWIFRDYKHLTREEIIKQEDAKIEITIEDVKH